jgi:hypothetical protein
MLLIQLRIAFNRVVLYSGGDFPQLDYRHSLQLIESIGHDSDSPYN